MQSVPSRAANTSPPLQHPHPSQARIEPERQSRATPHLARGAWGTMRFVERRALESRPPLPALRIDCPYRGVGAARKPSNVPKIQDAPLNHLIFKPSHVSPQHTASRPKPYPQQKDALHNHPRPPWIHRDGPRVRQFQGSPHIDSRNHQALGPRRIPHRATIGAQAPDHVQ